MLNTQNLMCFFSKKNTEVKGKFSFAFNMIFVVEKFNNSTNPLLNGTVLGSVALVWLLAELGGTQSQDGVGQQYMEVFQTIKHSYEHQNSKTGCKKKHHFINRKFPTKCIFKAFL